MKVFDQVDPVTLDRRQLHLAILAVTVILTMATGTALLMYPTVLSGSVILSGETQRKLFFGFCVLSVLLAGYFLDRQLTILQLRKLLEAERQRIRLIREEASSQLLQSLPGASQFQDRLAMEFRRASTTRQPLSALIVNLKPSSEYLDAIGVSTSFGDAAKALLRALRGEDSIFQLRNGSFAILLPTVSATDAYRVSDRVADRLRAASGASECFTFEIQVVNYPEHVASAREMEKVALPLAFATSKQQALPRAA